MHPSRSVVPPSASGFALAGAAVLAGAFPAVAAAAPRPGRALVARTTVAAHGHGRSARYRTHIDVFDASGARRRVATLGKGGLFAEPALSPDGRLVAVGRPDGRIAVVTVATGAVRTFRPALPRGAAYRGTHPSRSVTAWSTGGGAQVSWSPDGRAVVSHSTVTRSPSRWAGTLVEARSVACVLRTGRCTPADDRAPADLLPLAHGRTLRLDGLLADARPDFDGPGSISGFTERQVHGILAARRVPLVSTASLTRTVTGTGRRTTLDTVRGTTGNGAQGLGPATASGSAGVLLRRTETRLGPDTDQLSTEPSVSSLTRTLRPWAVSSSGRLSTFSRRLTVDPIGALADGRWLLPTADVARGDSADAPEPELATLDRRGTVARLPVGGRPLTPVRLALEAGLPDPFAAGARAVSAWPQGRDLLVELVWSGTSSSFFFPADCALVRVPLDGSAPARLVDHAYGASYAVR